MPPGRAMHYHRVEQVFRPLRVSIRGPGMGVRMTQGDMYTG